MKWLKTPPSLPFILAVVGWGLALALATHSALRPHDPAPPLEIVALDDRARALDKQVEPILASAREQLALGHPDRALEQVAEAFALCRAYDERPPIACYETFVDALSQSMAARAKAEAVRPMARASSAIEPTSSAGPAPGNPPPTEHATESPAYKPQGSPPPRRRANPHTPPDFSLPGPSYPIARHSHQCPPPPPPGQGWGPPPDAQGPGHPEGMPEPPRDWRDEGPRNRPPGPPMRSGQLPSGDMQSFPPGPPPPPNGPPGDRRSRPGYPGPQSGGGFPPYPPAENEGIPGYR